MSYPLICIVPCVLWVCRTTILQLYMKILSLVQGTFFRSSTVKQTQLQPVQTLARVRKELIGLALIMPRVQFRLVDYTNTKQECLVWYNLSYRLDVVTALSLFSQSYLIIFWPKKSCSIWRPDFRKWWWIEYGAFSLQDIIFYILVPFGRPSKVWKKIMS